MNANDIDGWMSEDELDWLRSNTKGCKRILEIGSWKGCRTPIVAEAGRGLVP
jgi:hypothetical protein